MEINFVDRPVSLEKRIRFVPRQEMQIQTSKYAFLSELEIPEGQAACITVPKEKRGSVYGAIYKTLDRDKFTVQSSVDEDNPDDVNFWIMSKE